MAPPPRTPDANRYKMGVGQMNQLSKLAGPGRKRRRYNHSITPSDQRARLAGASSINTSNPSESANSTPEPSTSTSITRSTGDDSLSARLIGWDSRSIYKPPFEVSIESILPKPHLYQEEEIDQRQISIAEANRLLHNNLGVTEKDSQPDLWLHYHRELDIHTPGMTSVSGFLYSTRMVKGEEEADYTSRPVALDDLPQLFDQMNHDYNIRSHKISKRVAIQWLAPSGLRASDIRSRPFRVHLRDESDKSLESKVVWRSEFRCDGACQMEEDGGIVQSFEKKPADLLNWVTAKQRQAYIVSKLKGQDRSQDEDDLGGSQGDEDNNDDLDDDRQAVQGHTCTAKLWVTITVDQVATRQCTITYMKPELHPGCRFIHRLRKSPLIRDELHRAGLGMGMTAAKLKIWFHENLKIKHPHSLFLETHHSHRMPNNLTYNQTITTILRQQRIDKDPLVAIEHVASINPSLFLHVSHSGSISHPDIPAKDKKPISCIIAPPHAIDNAILYGHCNGLFMDSSWRNKNAHRAPMTVLATHDDLHRMVPIAVMISQHAGEWDYRHFLKTVKAAVEERAKILDSQAAKPAKSEDLHDRILQHATFIVEDTFMPPFVMIDGCDAERAAIDAVWPNIYKRVCQFHLMQAVRGHCRSYFGTLPPGELKTTAVLNAIRVAQRCPAEEQWAESWTKLGATVTDIAQDRGQTWRDLGKYLKAHWFSDRWRKYCVDYGLPNYTFAEGPWSTNNYVESTFRVFDRVLLSGRSNKRLDRLVVIIIKYYFPFYEYLPHTETRPDPNLTRALIDGLNCWQADVCRQLHLDSPDIPIELRGRVKRIFTARAGSDKIAHYPHELLAGNGRWQCTCAGWSLSGKQCAHLWASGVLADFGSIDSYEANCELIAAIRFNSKNRSGKGSIDDSERTLGHQSMPEETEDLKLFWGGDIFAKQYLGKMNTCPDIRPDLLAKYQQQMADAAKGDERPPRKKPVFQPGPSAKIKPLQHGRTKPKKSTLVPPVKSQVAIDRMSPSGLGNTGNDCFGTALLQILLRQSKWRAIFTLSKTGKAFGSSALCGLIADVIDALDSKRQNAKFPTLNQLLSMAMGQAPGQHDPSELHQLLHPQLDRLISPASSRPFHNLFRFETREGYQCPVCKQWSYLGSSANIPVAVPSEAGYESNVIRASFPCNVITTIEERLGQSTALSGSVALRQCQTAGCGTAITSGLTVEHRFPSDLLMVEVTMVDPPSDDPFGETRAPLSGKFDLNSSIIFGSTEWSPPGAPASIIWRLVGIVCRAGLDPSTGHYIAMIHEEGSWWIADDGKVNSSGSTRAAFDNLRAPRMLLYSKVSVTGRVTPAANSGANAQGDKHSGGTKGSQSTFDIQPSSPVVYPKLDPTPPLVTAFDPSSPLSEWKQRYRALRWASHDLVNPIINAASINRPPISADSLDRINREVPPQHRTVYDRLTFGVEGSRRLVGGWLTNGIIKRFAEFLTVLLESKPPTAFNHRAWVAPREFVEYDSRSRSPLLGPNIHTDGTVARPGPSFGIMGSRNHCWRSDRTIFSMSSNWDLHFNAVIVFGPERLIVPFDGAGGAHTHTELKKAWSTIMRPRLLWELENGWVTEEDNRGWLVAPNDQDTRDYIDWVEQTDGSSCGPLVIAAMASAAIGFKPCQATLGLKKGVPLNSSDASSLRSRILGFAYGQLMVNAKYWLYGSDDFNKHEKAWVFKWAEWRRGER